MAEIWKCTAYDCKYNRDGACDEHILIEMEKTERGYQPVCMSYESEEEE